MLLVYSEQRGENNTAMCENQPEQTRHSLQPDLWNTMCVHLDLTRHHKLPYLHLTHTYYLQHTGSTYSTARVTRYRVSQPECPTAVKQL